MQRTVFIPLLLTAWLVTLLATVAAPSVRGQELLPADRSVEEAIDYYVDAGLDQAGIKAAAPADDAAVVRRLTLDLVGRIPTVAETREYMGSDRPDKRAALVEALIESPGFVRYQAYLLDSMLMPEGSGSLQEYLLPALAENRPWNQMFRELLLEPAPDKLPKGADEFIKRRVGDLDKLTNETSVLFFGVNISCAKCHDHPLVDDWKQDHFYGMESFFSRMYDNGGFLGERDYGLVSFRTTSNEEKQARLMFLSGTQVEEPETKEPTGEEKKQEKKRLEEYKKKKEAPPPPKFSRRSQLVDVALRPGENQFFARAMVNRLWHRMFDCGLVMPLDQMHSGNPPSHPELLDWLARDFIEHGYDLRRVLRGIALSRAYNRGTLWEEGDRPRADLFAVSNLRPLTPRQYATSLRLATTDPATLPADMKRDDFEKKIESIENSARGFADLIEMPGEDFQIGVDEALLLSNSDRVLREFLGEGGDRLVSRLKDLDQPREIIETAIWSTYHRPPTSEELGVLLEYLDARKDRRLEACQQLVWALVTSAEFRFNH